METHLTIKHIAPYLPYRLNFKGKRKDYVSFDENRQHTLCPIDLDGRWEIIKPILRPLSDITKEDLDTFSVSVRRALNEDYNEEKLLSRVCYYELQWLLEWHFDVFGLIEQGLAIDINSLTEKG
jgi:hypothetical protein